MDYHDVLKTISEIPISILDASIPISKYEPIDLSSSNIELSEVDITNPVECQSYIDLVLSRKNGFVAYGGYLEKRNLYANTDRFSEGESRNIHLGMDFWCAAGTKVVMPLNGVVHSFKNNSDYGNYGPTIIIQHQIQHTTYYSLYGHLSIESLNDLYLGKTFNRGEVFAALGDTPINVNYAPHLHFQLILDIKDYQGDYPGVCSQADLDFYKNNCPAPNLLLGL